MKVFYSKPKNLLWFKVNMVLDIHTALPEITEQLMQEGGKKYFQA